MVKIFEMLYCSIIIISSGYILRENSFRVCVCMCVCIFCFVYIYFQTTAHYCVWGLCESSEYCCDENVCCSYNDYDIWITM